jgi:hypothetical protein
MPSQPASGYPTSVVHLVEFAFPSGEWQLLTGLPRQVMIAASSAAPDNPGRTVVECLAGLDAIAAGRASDTDLVRAVVAAIYAEADPGVTVAAEFGDRAAGRTRVLTECRNATGVLAVRADPAESAAYRQWVQSIAARVCAASASSGPPGGAERRFLADLGSALGLR